MGSSPYVESNFYQSKAGGAENSIEGPIDESHVVRRAVCVAPGKIALSADPESAGRPRRASDRGVSSQMPGWPAGLVSAGNARQVFARGSFVLSNLSAARAAQR